VLRRVCRVVAAAYEPSADRLWAEVERPRMPAEFRARSLTEYEIHHAYADGAGMSVVAFDAELARIDAPVAKDLAGQ
jgi:hypothetical protein